MRKIILPRHFIFSVLLLLALVSAYVYSEARRLQDELLRQAQAKGLALADAVETNVRSAVLGNRLLEDLIAQRLLDNARLIDRLLAFPPVDQAALEDVAAVNRLQKIELLDSRGRPLPPDELPGRRMRRMMMQHRRAHAPGPSAAGPHGPMMFMWGRRWGPAQDRSQPVPQVAERKFWEGSVFGVAIGASSFPGIIAVHANADYILNFRKEIEVQKQIEELGRRSDIEHIALIDRDFKILAHTDARRVDQRSEDPLLTRIPPDGGPAYRIAEGKDGSRHYDVVKAVSVGGSLLGFLEIGLSLRPVETAWRQSLRSMVAFGLAVLAAGVLGMGAIFYNQQTHLRKVRSLQSEIDRRERLSQLGNLAATVAHEIRNPLNAIAVGLQRLQAEFSPANDRDEYARFLEIILGEVRRLNATVEQFLSLARPLSLNPEKIAVPPLLAEVRELMAGDASAAGVQIELKVPAGLPAIRADRNHLKQMLLNLILNGIQAMPDGGRLTVEAAADRRFLRLEVADEGPGIAPEVREKIFEPYYTTKPGGSGIGLSIVRRIAEAHGGRVSVESAPSRGARFCVFLPREASES